MLQSILVFSMTLLTLPSFGLAEGFFWDTKNQERLEQAEFFDRLKPKSLLIFGETHAVAEGERLEKSKAEHRRQGDLIRAYGIHLKNLKEGLDGGYEFIAYTEQFTITRYFYGNITLEKFLGEVSWPMSHPFEQYERQFHFPIYFQGKSYGVNAPFKVLKKISESGLVSLTDEERSQLPEEISEEDPAYFERFREKMKDHPDQSKIPYLFAANLASDETIAWSTSNISTESNNRMVLIVDEFKIMFNEGLTKRAKVRSRNREIYTLVQRENLNQKSNSKPIADFIWVTVP